MIINIIGGNGTVGNGIKNELNKLYKVCNYASKDFDFENNCFFTEDVFNCDVFIHSAGITDEQIKENIFTAVHKHNLFNKYLINKLKNSNKIKYIIYISSVHVYGKLGSILDVSTPSNPLSIYAILHLLTENILIEEFAKNDIKLLILRVPTVYGFPSNLKFINRPNIIQYSFPNELLVHGRIKILTSGENYRTFISSFKIGQLIIIWLNKTMKKKVTITPIKGRSIKIKDFATLCIKQFKTLKMGEANLLIQNSSKKEFSDINTLTFPYIDCNDNYSLEEYLVDYFKEINSINRI